LGYAFFFFITAKRGCRLHADKRVRDVAFGTAAAFVAAVARGRVSLGILAGRTAELLAGRHRREALSTRRAGVEYGEASPPLERRVLGGDPVHEDHRLRVWIRQECEAGAAAVLVVREENFPLVIGRTRQKKRTQTFALAHIPDLSAGTPPLGLLLVFRTFALAVGGFAEGNLRSVARRTFLVLVYGKRYEVENVWFFT